MLTQQSTTTFPTRVRRFALSEPLKAAWEHGNQFFVTSAAAFMSAAFSMQHDVLPIWIAVPLAIGFEWTYLRGLATADKTTKTPWAVALNWAAMLTSLVYGILYVLGHYHVIADTPGTTAAIWLAFAHVFPMALLSFCGANLRRNQKLEELRRNQKLVAEQDARNQREQDAATELRLDMQRKEAELDIYTRGLIAAAEAKAAIAATRKRNQIATAPAPARRTIMIDGLEFPSIQAAADHFGITRQAMSKRLRKQ